MECDICHREYDAKQRPFLCAVDARNQIYEGRLKNAQLLIQNEELRSRIDGLMSEVDKGSQFALEKSKVQQRMTEDKTSQILAAADKLKEDIRTAREDVSIRRAALASRRFDFDAISKGLSERRARQQDEIEENIATYRTAWDQIAQDTAGTRYFLCSTAAELYGLSRVPKAGDGGDDFFMGKVPVVNLIALNGRPAFLFSVDLPLNNLWNRNVAGSDFNLSGSFIAYFNIGGTLPGYTATCRDNASTSRLSSPYDLQP